ncbi:hypothetical protein QPK87_09645 [Kamptonema cortianum]|nr:hypothetical protein [Geitlerinema splendidum]MDK3156837.1 hypothetical protein [Kamptonema cortianum]
MANIGLLTLALLSQGQSAIAPSRISVMALKQNQDYIRSELYDRDGRLVADADSAFIIAKLTQKGFVHLGDKDSVALYADSSLLEISKLNRSIRAFHVLSKIPPWTTVKWSDLTPSQRDDLLGVIDPGSSLLGEVGSPKFSVLAYVNCQVPGQLQSAQLMLGEPRPEIGPSDNYQSPDMKAMEDLTTHPFTSKFHPKYRQSNSDFGKYEPMDFTPRLIHLNPRSKSGGRSSHMESTLNKWLADAYLKHVFELNEHCVKLQEEFVRKYESLLRTNQWGIKFGEEYRYYDLPENVQKKLRQNLLFGKGLDGDIAAEENFLRQTSVTFNVSLYLSLGIDNGGTQIAVNSFPLMGSQRMTPP